MTTLIKSLRSMEGGVKSLESFYCPLNAPYANEKVRKGTEYQPAQKTRG